MKRNFLLLFITFSLSFALASAFDYEPTQAGSSFTTELLSDPNLTAGDAMFRYAVKTNGDIAYAYWQENGNNSEGIDLFYRQLPGGSTIQLSDPALSEGDVSPVWYDAAVAPDGTFHIVWLEETNTAEAGDLFYWSADTGTLLLSDRTQTEGGVQSSYTLDLVLDKNSIPHIIWHEETGTAEGEDLFYWSPTTGTILLTDRSETEGDYLIFGLTNLLLDDDGTPHIVWSEYGNDGTTAAYFYWNPTLGTPTILPAIEEMVVAGTEAHIFWLLAGQGPIHYWNSSTATDIIIPSSTNTVSFSIAKPRMFSDSNDTVHILWGEPGTNVCLSHWDSDNQATSNVATGENCDPYWALEVDSNGRFHAIVPDKPSGSPGYRIKYWNSDMADSVIVKSTDNLNITSVTLSAPSNSSPAYLTWMETTSDNLDSNFFQWNSSAQVVLNLSESAGENTLISATTQLIRVNEAGDLHMIWSEQIDGIGSSQFLYWNSVTNTTQNLFTDLSITSLHPILNRLYLNLQEDGSPYVVWHGTVTGDPEGLYVWDSAKNELLSAGESSICSSFNSQSAKDSNFYFTWQDEITLTNYFWNKDDGQITLNLTTASETVCAPPALEVSQSGRVFVLWLEESDTDGEGLDVYAGWLDAPDTVNNTNSVIYLPFITK